MPRIVPQGAAQRYRFSARFVERLLARVPLLSAWVLAEIYNSMLVVDRHFARADEHVHADEHGRLILQAPEIEDVKVADIRLHAVDDGVAKTQTRCPDTLLEYDRAPECEGVSV